MNRSMSSVTLTKLDILCTFRSKEKLISVFGLEGILKDLPLNLISTELYQIEMSDFKVMLFEEQDTFYLLIRVCKKAAK
jgi:hypothetical protein